MVSSNLIILGLPTVVLYLLLGLQLAGSLELKAISQKGVILVSLIHHLSQACFQSSGYNLDASIPSEYQVITFAPTLKMLCTIFLMQLKILMGIK